MSANLVIVYTGAALREVAEAIAEAAESLSARVRLLRVPEGTAPTELPDATIADLEWANGIAFGTPLHGPGPAPELLRFLADIEPLGQSDRLYDKVVTTFTDQPERFAPNDVVHPIWDAAYQWGAILVGPRASELELDARERRLDTRERGPGDEGPETLSGPRLRTAQYRGRRLATLASLIAGERSRRLRLEL